MARITRSKLIEERIRYLWENTDFSATIFQNLTGYAVIAADFDGNIMAYSEGARLIFGYEPEEIIGRLNFDIFSPADYIFSRKLTQTLDKLLKTGRVEFEAAQLRKKGESFPAHISMNLANDSEGKVVGFVAIIEDLSERRRIEAALGNYHLHLEQMVAEKTANLEEEIEERKLAQAETSRLNRALNTLSKCNEVLVRATHKAGLLNQICRTIVEQGGYPFVWVGFAGQGNDKPIRIAAHAGIDQSYLDKLRLTWADNSLGQCPAAKTIRSGKTGMAKNVRADPSFAQWHEIIKKLNLFSAISLPIKDGKKVLGALCLYSTKKEVFDKKEVKLLEELAGDLSFGVVSLRHEAARRRGEEDLKKSAERMRQTFEGVTLALAKAVESRDPYTAGHEQRVADLSMAIGEEMGLPGDRVEGLRVSASLHDLGKIGVPAEILSSPARLTEAQFSLVKSHPQVSDEILSTIEFPWPVSKIVRQHHERLDGSGYPDHIKGDEILLEAKILCVADVVEAMSSHRPYRPALGLDKAIMEISKDKGIKYDPDVVDACIKVFASGRFSLAA